MPTFDLAHVRRDGQDMILFPLNASFGQKPLGTQRSTLAALEQRARAAGLRGHAVAIWDDGRYKGALGPPQWRGFLSSVQFDWVLANVNRQLHW